MYFFGSMSSIDWPKLREALVTNFTANKISQTALQEEVGVNQSYVSRLLNGRYSTKKPTKKVRSLCIKANLNLDHFLIHAPPHNANELLDAISRLCQGNASRERALGRLLKALEGFGKGSS
jgi:transcriptional regulator with XRE-family HTH domain